MPNKDIKTPQGWYKNMARTFSQIIMDNRFTPSGLDDLSTVDGYNRFTPSGLDGLVTVDGYNHFTPLGFGWPVCGRWL